MTKSAVFFALILASSSLWAQMRAAPSAKPAELPDLYWAIARPAGPLSDQPHKVPVDGIRGITVAPIEDRRLGDVGYGSGQCHLALREIHALGATWISLTPFGRMDDLDSIDIQHDFEIPVGLNLEMIRQTVLGARARGLKIAIIPHLYVMSGRWRGEIDPGSDANWDTWFDEYEQFVLRFADLAQTLEVDLFSIGVEFKSSTNYHEDKWRRLIQKIRAVYQGPLTYSANWDEIDQVQFWDALDFIGINAFWPLAEQPGDGFDVMRAKADQISEVLEPLSIYWNRPVLFTEMGVKSSSDAALAPWEWPEHLDQQIYNEEYQAAAYQAVLESLTDKSWFAGFFVWKYFADPDDTTQEAPFGFSPRKKMAEQVLSRWLHRPWDNCPTLLHGE